MFFILGVFFLLGSLSVSSALPPCVCTKNLKPVCGSDGQTYNNDCLLQCAQVSNPELVVDRPGRCDGSNLGPPRDVRQVQDCICTLEYQPFCGTDGLTYPNRCSLNCAQRSAPVEIAYPGECRIKRETVQATQPSNECECPRTYEPVCGTNGITYDNDCFLNCAKPNNKDLEILHDDTCDSVKVIDSEECVGCTLKVKPVCGTDGKVYRNPCMLNCVREKDESLHIAFEGRCNNKVKVGENIIFRFALNN